MILCFLLIYKSAISGGFFQLDTLKCVFFNAISVISVFRLPVFKIWFMAEDCFRAFHILKAFVVAVDCPPGV